MKYIIFNVLIHLFYSFFLFNPVNFMYQQKDQFHVQPYILLIYNAKI